jgi:hypothetical protein
MWFLILFTKMKISNDQAKSFFTMRSERASAKNVVNYTVQIRAKLA